VFAGMIRDRPSSASNLQLVERLVSNRDSGVQLSSSGSRSLSCDRTDSDADFTQSV